MSFPKLEVPKLKCTLPITGAEVTYRPYTVKEDKLLNLVATEKDTKKLTKDILNVISELAQVCTFNKVDIDELPVPDVEYLFLKIKSASAGSVREKSYKCRIEDDTGKECGANINIKIDLDDIKLEGEMPNNIIKLNDSLSLMLKAPVFKNVKKLTMEKLSDNSLDIIAASVDMVVYNDETITEFTTEEITENVLKNMTETQLNYIKEFFDNMPMLVYKTSFICHKCKNEHDLEIKHLVNFFG